VNEIAYTELILCIDFKASYDKIAFNIVKGCKNNYYTYENAVNAWEKLNINYEPLSAPFTVKLDKHFRDSSLKKDKIMKFGSVSFKIFVSGLMIWLQEFQRIYL
jgi:hypothetical protein